MKELNKLRNEIDEIDKKLVQLFEKRLEIVSRISEYKKMNFMAIEDKNREKELISNNLLYCRNRKYSSYIVDFLESIIEISKKMQSDYR